MLNFNAKYKHTNTNYGNRGKTIAHNNSLTVLNVKAQTYISTMAGSEGHCVSRMQKINNKALIINIERDQNILSSFLKKELGVKALKRSVKAHVNKKTTVGYLNFDTVSWLDLQTIETLKRINSREKSKLDSITLTLPYSALRGRGEEMDKRRKNYAQWLIDNDLENNEESRDLYQKFELINILTNYKLLLVGKHESSGKKRKEKVKVYSFKYIGTEKETL